MNILNNISDISLNYYHYFFTYQNVIGVGFGYKFINGIESNELCIHVLVKKKVPKAYLTCNNIIPKTYMGIKTDVIEIGTPKISGFPEKYRPLKGGCGIYSKGATFNGTLGCVVVRKTFFKNKYFILSNNHVLADSNKIPLGTEVIQPTLIDGGEFKDDVVAKLSEFKPIKFSTGLIKPKNFVDCAIAEITNKAFISKEVLRIGELTGVAIPNLKTLVRKVGLRGGLTNGMITSVGVTMDIDFDLGKKALFSNVIIATLLSIHGDSGSIVVNNKNQVVGLLFGSDYKGISFINDINTVLKELNVEIYK